MQEARELGKETCKSKRVGFSKVNMEVESIVDTDWVWP